MDAIQLRLERIEKDKIDEGSTFSDSSAWDYIKKVDSDYRGEKDFVLYLFKKSHARQALTHVIFYAGISVLTLAIMEIIARILDTNLLVYTTQHVVNPLWVLGLIVVIALSCTFEFILPRLNKPNDKKES